MAIAAPSSAAADADRDGPVLSASPDAPATGLTWRDQLRGTLALTLHVAGRVREGLAFVVLPLIELHNDRPDAFPNNYWRGRLAAELSWGWAGETRWDRSVVVRLAVEHESDHATAPVLDEYTGFLTTNDVALGGTLGMPLRFGVLRATATVRAYFLTCTVDDFDCVEDSGTAGGSAIGGELDLVLDGEPPGRAPGALRGFAALIAGGIAPADQTPGEARLVLHAGAYLRRPDLGVWQLFAELYLGNQVGFTRRERVSQVGVGFRFAP